jgi:non-ribosomal peptide synthetase component E (peptide arylation enzyme)
LYPTKVAVVDSTTRLTWEQVKIESDGQALRFLELGLKKDDIALVQLQNTADLFLPLLAFEKAGIIALGCPPTFRKAEIESIVRHAGVVGAVVPGRYGSFDYCQMVKGIKQEYPSLRYLFISGEPVTEGTIPLKEVFRRNLRENIPNLIFKLQESDHWRSFGWAPPVEALGLQK